MGWELLRKIRWAAIGGLITFGITVAGLFYARWNYGLNVDNYNLSLAKEQRERNEKEPAIEVQVNHDGVSNASLIISITNRGEVSIVPLDITVDHSDEIGDLYLSSATQSIQKMKSSMSLTSLGSIAPKTSRTTKAVLSGITDGKDDSFQPGVEFLFTVRIRYADPADTIESFRITRHILPPVAQERCPPPFVLGPRPPGCG